jgi:hypothetical protein
LPLDHDDIGAEHIHLPNYDTPLPPPIAPYQAQEMGPYSGNCRCRDNVPLDDSLPFFEDSVAEFPGGVLDIGAQDPARA